MGDAMSVQRRSGPPPKLTHLLRSSLCPKAAARRANPPASAGRLQQSQPLSLLSRSSSCAEYDGGESGDMLVMMTGEGVRRG
jgi:hypothetical protein